MFTIPAIGAFPAVETTGLKSTGNGSRSGSVSLRMVQLELNAFPCIGWVLLFVDIAISEASEQTTSSLLRHLAGRPRPVSKRRPVIRKGSQFHWHNMFPKYLGLLPRYWSCFWVPVSSKTAIAALARDLWVRSRDNQATPACRVYHPFKKQQIVAPSFSRYYSTPFSRPSLSLLASCQSIFTITSKTSKLDNKLDLR